MLDEPAVVIAGATGLIGNEIVAILSQEKFPCGSVKLLDAGEAVGEVYSVCGEEVVIDPLNEEGFEGAEIVFLAGGAEVSEQFTAIALESGAYVIDLSSRSRMEAHVPLIVPEVNAELLCKEKKLVASPNACVAMLAPVLHVIDKTAGLERAVVSTYQATSGAGKGALDELWEQTRAVYAQTGIECEAFQHQIAFNVIPHIDIFLENGYTREEQKIVAECRKVLNRPALRMTATAVRVPTLHGYGLALNVETQKALTPDQLNRELEKVPGIEVCHAYSDYPMPLLVVGTNAIATGRIRVDDSVPHGLNIWISSDNVRKGTALNAVQIARAIIARCA